MNIPFKPQKSIKCPFFVNVGTFFNNSVGTVGNHLSAILHDVHSELEDIPRADLQQVYSIKATVS